jgi:hypothetical protein
MRLGTHVETVPARNLCTRYGSADLGIHTLHYEGAGLNESHLPEDVRGP